MQRLALILFTLLLATTLTATHSLAAPYLSINGGTVLTSDSDLSVQGHDSSGEYEYDLGYVMAIACGNSYASGLRAELEIPYRFNDIDKYTMEGSNPEEFDREISSLSLMANIYYDFSFDSAFKPFVGAGIGYSKLEIEGRHDHHNDYVFAYQVMAGCGYAITSKWIIDLQYRFFATEDPEFEINDPDLGNINIDAEYSSQNLMLGLRYIF